MAIPPPNPPANSAEAHERIQRFIASYGIPDGCDDLYGPDATTMLLILALGDMMNWAADKKMDFNRALAIARKMHRAEYGAPHFEED